ncbi:Phosphoenolpyruvate synthase/pyruvate phosphate dikinase [Pyrobaculum oguniense TE7]|uniref:Phosphoenolpyruvate synthase/pyruvate phosphate dikinase n=1 Tax=Pyrobaculum oguniense (strain DSM 13380 / JCM 10595 / TE7) TaxID=698757 RepID=H6Q9E7_PYROT|nr:Phosphoenolpyruvate synthase/pyruvate phosphate dikinase [Pyrobaculum oguniense TE7]
MCASEARPYLYFQTPIRELFADPPADLVAEEDGRFWYHDAVHFGDGPLYPMDYSLTVMLMDMTQSAYYNRVFAMPTSRGRATIMVKGRPYRTSFQEGKVGDPEVFERRLRFYLENWDSIYEQWKREVLEIIKELESLEFELPEGYEPDEAVYSRAYPSPQRLLENWMRLLALWMRLWFRHYEMLMLGYAVYDFFYRFCKAVFPDIPDHHITLMMSGRRPLDVELPEKTLRELAKLARELGVGDLVLSAETPEDLEKALAGAGEAGAKWLAAWRESFAHFHVSTGSGMLHTDARWDERPEIPLAILKNYIRSPPPERPRPDPDAVALGYAQLLPEDLRDLFWKYLDVARRVYPYIEEHSFYVENWGFSVGYKKIHQVGRLLAKWGVLASEDDIWYLNWFEVMQALLEAATVWASGRSPVGKHWWGRVARRREEFLKALSRETTAPYLGALPSAVRDSNLAMLHRIGGGDGGRGLVGVGASPGVAEGFVVVVRGYDDFAKVRSGVVIVAPTIAPTWAPLLSQAAAVVTDSGGVMSHAAILAREYGVPAVVGTGNATKVLRDGAKVRVDGGRGVVEVLCWQNC